MKALPKPNNINIIEAWCPPLAARLRVAVLAKDLAETQYVLGVAKDVLEVLSAHGFDGALTAQNAVQTTIKQVAKGALLHLGSTKVYREDVHRKD